MTPDLYDLVTGIARNCDLVLSAHLVLLHMTRHCDAEHSRRVHNYPASRLAQELGISARAAQSAIAILRKLRLIQTEPVPGSQTLDYVLEFLPPIPGDEELSTGERAPDANLADGANLADPYANSAYAYANDAPAFPPPQTHAKPLQPPLFPHAAPSFPQFPPRAYKEVSYSKSPQERERLWKVEKPAPPPPPEPEENENLSAEVVVFAEVALGAKLDPKLSRQFARLPAELGIPEGLVAEFTAWKCGQRESHPRFSPGALLEFVRNDLHRLWESGGETAILRVTRPWTARKGPGREGRRHHVAAASGAY